MVNTNRFFLVFIFIFCLNLLLNAIYLFSREQMSNEIERK